MVNTDFEKLTKVEKHKLLLDAIGLKVGDKLTRCFITGYKRKKTNDYRVTFIPEHFEICKNDKAYPDRGYHLEEFYINKNGEEIKEQYSSLYSILAVLDSDFVFYGKAKYNKKTTVIMKSFPAKNDWKNN